MPGRGLNVKPLLESGAVGVVDQFVQRAAGSHPYFVGVFRFGALATGYALKRAGADYTLSMGIMVSAATLIGNQIPVMFQKADPKAILYGYTAPSARPSVARGAVAPDVTSASRPSIDEPTHASGGTILPIPSVTTVGSMVGPAG